MRSHVSELARPRRGHFDLGTGYHGDLWLDLDGLFLFPDRLQPDVQRLADRLGRYHTVQYRGRQRIGQPRRTRTWHSALVHHFGHIAALRLLTGLEVADRDELDWLVDFVKELLVSRLRDSM